MMATRLPPLTALRSFEAAARHLSFTKAADELAVTQAAVSYQIRQLEDHLGQSVFTRHTRRLELTPAGEDLRAAVADALARIRAAVDRLAARRNDKVLAITTLPTFAGQWLVPRLGHFQYLRPDIAVRLDSSTRLTDMARGEFDVAIRSGKGDWPDVVAERLIAFTVTPALSPLAAARIGGVREPADLLRLPALDSQHPDDRRLWREWFRLAGMEVENLPPGPQFDMHVITGTAAASGQGVALVCPAFFAADIAAGRLVLPFPDRLLTTDWDYWLVYAPHRANEPAIRAFRDWITGEVSACAGQCASIGHGGAPFPTRPAPAGG
ncbi:MAG: hypothetical protein RLY86_1242 [Pseudomonadota bacterium]